MNTATNLSAQTLISPFANVVVYTLGCKTNQYEGESLVQDFERAGLVASDKLVPAEVYIINSCSVTMEADKKSRQMCSRVAKINPQATVYVCGCSVVKLGEEHLGGAKVIAVNQDKGSIVGYILKHHAFAKIGCSQYKRRARVHIKIQDGCNDFCSFCIIPFLRGRSKSRDISDIVHEISGIDAHEIVLTGINLTAYGKDNNATLTSLVRSIRTGARIRLSSIECSAINRELLVALKGNNGCPHFHVSLQSGSDRVLRAMNRKYTVAEFEDKMSLIREIFGDNVALTTDIIVGYPTETDKDFDDTIRLVDKIGFTDVHIFRYSSRPGTTAARLPMLNTSTIDIRFQQLSNLVKGLKKSFLDKQIGRVVEVCFDNTSSKQPIGYTDNYCKVVAQDAKPNSLVTVKIIDSQADILLCQIVS